MDNGYIRILPQSGIAGKTIVTVKMVATNDTFEDKIFKVRAVCGNKFKDLIINLKGKANTSIHDFSNDFSNDFNN